ncbi:pyruvate/2-oxoglutarate dehydrogenase complex dihydrolipoamide acyltransferase (E2) component [Cytobacillus horneckiae]|uniref:Dihydrolipoamide acetyltransferase component of pyruvate dehydrogenase complex n=1 Tax=Cytobacillus horneckiae TaxID=549687 RepID=A0A2N0ZIP0_9BACI|nr:dihydrolipoamide acetyltransferase family protein [Cytobacillus horneckiae]MBN6886667.1 2-oxo acid dehydrogenase subunit E2 [Cytobacillus horneckiae]MEC1157332.1 dihydrolipoamide acetyltransferase family protein [Cytobacillus horneckiae]MED2935787.1 dihydrolipoamide acetyltransferase family protein [Cytobacillus horneckiae]PKG29373.1 2-oxo acid dehydrogenase subunit E2 [Cytobacillus horneckiae]
MEVKLHDIGEGMTEAEIVSFLVKPGDVVKADTPIVEVQTDKMTAEIPSPIAGIIGEFNVKQGQTVPVGTTLLFIQNHSDSENQKERLISLPPSQHDTHQNHLKRILAAPYTRKIARENGVEIENIKGTGLSGRIIDEDIYRYLEQSKTQSINSSLFAEKQQEPSPLINEQQDDTIPFRGRRKQIANNMMHSVQTIPHCTHFEEIDVTDLLQFKQNLKEIGRDISATAFFLKALSICLKEYPIFNAQLDIEKEIIIKNKEHHFGIAIDMEEGLIVPVLRNIENKSIQSIHVEMKDLSKKAKENKLSVKDITGGTFTISNVGPLGGSFGATPIIQHPQVALVSFHKTKKMPVVADNDQIIIRSIMNLSMSFDHRVADGASAVRFTNRFAQLINDPKMLILEMV